MSDDHEDFPDTSSTYRFHRQDEDPWLSSAAGTGDPAEDEALLDVADAVRDALHQEDLRPEVKARQRAELVAAAEAQIAAARSLRAVRDPGPAGVPQIRAGRSGRGNHPVRRRTIGLSVAAATVVIGAAAAHLVAAAAQGGPVRVTAVSAQLGDLAVDAAGAVALRFSTGLDHASALAAIRVRPATAVRATWEGNTLTVTPLHGFSPNSGYLLTLDGSVARTADGSPLAADIRIPFGTAPQTPVDPAPGPAASLGRSPIVDAADGSEAVVTADGSLLMTAATPTGADAIGPGAVLAGPKGSTRLAPAADRICVSRSGRSIALLAREADVAGHQARLRFADGLGAITGHVAVVADPGTPIGWIGDAEVTFVSGGRLTAVDRSGHLRPLGAVRLDVAHENVVVSPGGQYVFVGGPGRNQLIDLVTGRSHPLTGIVGGPAFSADGAGVFWIEGSGAGTRLATAPSAGGLVTTVRLPVTDGESVGDLAVSPDGSRLVYSVTGGAGASQLRLAGLPTGSTIALSDAGPGTSPNWAPDGRRFAVLSSAGGRPRVEMVQVPESTADRRARVEATLRAFVVAQLGADAGAQGALLADPSTVPDQLAGLTRWSVVWEQWGADGSLTAQVRLTADASADRPERQSLETITVDSGTADRVPRVLGLRGGSLAPAPDAPQVASVTVDEVSGEVALRFTDDLDAASVQDGIRVVDLSGQSVPTTVRYDSDRRTARLSPRTTAPGAIEAMVVLSPALTDIAGRHPAPSQLPVRLTGR